MSEDKTPAILRRAPRRLAPIQIPGTVAAPPSAREQEIRQKVRAFIDHYETEVRNGVRRRLSPDAFAQKRAEFERALLGSYRSVTPSLPGTPGRNLRPASPVIMGTEKPTDPNDRDVSSFSTENLFLSYLLDDHTPSIDPESKGSPFKILLRTLFGPRYAQLTEDQTPHLTLPVSYVLALPQEFSDTVSDIKNDLNQELERLSSPDSAAPLDPDLGCDESLGDDEVCAITGSAPAAKKSASVDSDSDSMAVLADAVDIHVASVGSASGSSDDVSDKETESLKREAITTAVLELMKAVEAHLFPNPKSALVFADVCQRISTFIAKMPEDNREDIIGMIRDLESGYPHTFSRVLRLAGNAEDLSIPQLESHDFEQQLPTFFSYFCPTSPQDNGLTDRITKRESLLHVAIRNKKFTEAYWLLEQGLNPNVASEPNADTPLHLLLMQYEDFSEEEKQQAEDLLDQLVLGAYPTNALHRKNAHGICPLDWVSDPSTREHLAALAYGSLLHFSAHQSDFKNVTTIVGYALEEAKELHTDKKEGAVEQRKAFLNAVVNYENDARPLDVLIKNTVERRSPEHQSAITLLINHGAELTLLKPDVSEDLRASGKRSRTQFDSATARLQIPVPASWASTHQAADLGNTAGKKRTHTAIAAAGQPQTDECAPWAGRSVRPRDDRSPL